MADSTRPFAGRGIFGLIGRWLPLGLLAVLVACSPTFNWRDAPSPGGEFRVQLPAKPSSMSRPIHLENLAVNMTMVGARVGETAFTVAVVPAPAANPAEPSAGEDRLVRTMREQMLRNVGAAIDTPTRSIRVPLVDVDGRRVGELPALAVEADGVGAHAGVRLQGIFVRAAGHALQALVMGPPVDPAQSRHFFDSLQVVRR